MPATSAQPEAAIANVAPTALARPPQTRPIRKVYLIRVPSRTRHQSCFHTSVLGPEQLAALTPDAFVWATGIEDTFITAASPKTGRTLDEYELTQHYERWREDLELMRALGITTARYGVPWHRINPRPGAWEWQWADEPLERLLELKIAPIVDLVHYGLPPWIEGAFENPDFAAHMAEYATRLAERFRGRIFSYTPLNEPRITAWYSGKLGWWPPFRRGWGGFVDVLMSVCRGIVQTSHALRAIDPRIVQVHVDATDLYSSDDPGLGAEVQFREHVVFLPLDLVSGRVTERHPLRSWLAKRGVRDEALAWFAENAAPLDVVGINLYPLFSDKRLTRSRHGLRTRMPYASAEIVDRIAHVYWERYRRPLMITETASLGSITRRREWLEGSLAAVRRVRERGIPLVGYTWWPMFALITWAYRQGTHPAAYYVKQMGLFDLDGPDLSRVATPLVELFRSYVEAGSHRVGRIETTTSIAAENSKGGAHVS